VALDISAINRALNNVASVGQAQAAAGQALRDLSTYGYRRIDDGELSRFADVYNEPQTRARLDRLNARIHALYPRGNTSAAVDSSWPALAQAIRDAYGELAGIDGAAGTVRSVEFGPILLEAIADAPRVFGAAVGGVTAGIGSNLGSLTAGFLSEAWILVILVVAGFLLYRKVLA
jgi:hypothetical protein